MHSVTRDYSTDNVTITVALRGTYW